MSIENFEDRFQKRWERFEKRRGKNRKWFGALILIVGVLLLLKTTQLVIFPTWLFTWPVFFIAVGLFAGIRRGFRRGFWAVFLLIGGISLAEKLTPGLDLEKYIWPAVFIGLGLIFILRPKKNCWRHRGRMMRNAAPNAQPFSTEGDASHQDYLDVTAVFGGVKKNVITKNFKGGEITNFMGGSEIDLTQSDFSGNIRIDSTNVFGGTKLIVPANWEIHSEVTTFFGGVDDKRQVSTLSPHPDKIMIIDGTCVFGGIEIRSY